MESKASNRLRGTEATPADCTIVDDGSPTGDCPLSGVDESLGRTYTMQIVCVVGVHEHARFGVGENHVPTASTSTLSARLGALVDASVLEREQREEDVSKLLAVGQPLESVRREIGKCVPLCANCHRIEHHATECERG